MIRIRKPRQGPEILRKRGREETRRLCQAFDAEPATYRSSGDKTFDFDETLYGAPSVKKALRKAQHDKCAFCESKITHIGFGDVEHFRPKAGFVQQEGDKLSRPGYYWLAYVWNNLFLSCQLCNQRFKRNLFPLRDPAKRLASRHDALTQEEPLLIDPGVIDPEKHILWKKEYPEAAAHSQEGQATIDLLGLRREELTQFRREHLRTLSLLRKTLREYRQQQSEDGLCASAQTILRGLESRIRELIRDDAPYAAMTRAYFADTIVSS
jgi:uncharacterized protein (TIGR02646 family)